MTTNATTAKSLLEVMSTRLAMQQEGITNPPETIKIITKKLVDELSLLPGEENISIVIDKDHGEYIQESTGRVLAKIPIRGIEEIDDEMRKTLTQCGVVHKKSKSKRGSA